MRKILFIAPGWLAADPDESVLRQNLPGLQRLAELGSLSKLAPLPQTETPEALVLGFPPGQISLQQGPLTIAALGADPPDKSTHFHLSLMSLNEGKLTQHELDLPPEQVESVLSRAKALNTKSITIVLGEGKDHGLVWEGRGDIGMAGPSAVDGKALADVLPEGDNEPAFRRFIDDSVNLLGELDLNAERVDQGLKPINILWPWGPGTRVRVPNLALERGEPVEVLSPSLRLAGLTRLSGYRHKFRDLLVKGLNTNWETLRQKALAGNSILIWTPIFDDLRFRENLEEASWLTKQIDEFFVEPILRSAPETSTRFAILAPNSNGQGLAIVFQTKDIGSNVIPFDERAFDDRLSENQLHEMVNQLLQP